MNALPDNTSLRRARTSRDARFDGLFFVAVKTTGIYCRPICPANPPLEKNVEYHPTAISAAAAGFRPCLRCRPDAAPQSNAWQGTQTTFKRALKLINDGALQESSMAHLASRLGISSRYLRELFKQNLGVSPKRYDIYQRCLFAKQLLHESSLSITDVAFASGFGSVRRFNEAVQEHLGLTPGQIRRSDSNATGRLRLKLHYRPPFDWNHTWRFLSNRMIPNLEWVSDDAYHRTIDFNDTRGAFSVKHDSDNHCLILGLDLDDYRDLNLITQRIRQVFDVDAPIGEIDTHLSNSLSHSVVYQPGLRVPGIWSPFEAGVRAILGQQVSVQQALQLVSETVAHLGDEFDLKEHGVRKIFPAPEQILNSDLSFLKMPGSRKETLRRLAEHFLSHEDPHDIDRWIDIKGIGQWTVNYVKLRGTKDPDIWLAGDAGIKNALGLLDAPIDNVSCSPWCSYLTIQLWHQLAMRKS